MNNDHSIIKIIGQGIISILGAVVVYPLIIFFFVAMIGIFLNFFPSYHFSNEFGFFPTNDVKELEISTFIFKDDGKWFKFKANQITVDKIIEDKVFREIERNEIRDFIIPAKELIDNKDTKFYRSVFDSDKLKMGKILLLHNPKNGQVFVIDKQVYY